MKFISLPRGSFVAAAALLGIALSDSADAQVHHRYRHYQQGGQYQQYCPPTDYYSPSMAPTPAGVPTAPGMAPQAQPGQPTPADQQAADDQLPQQDFVDQPTAPAPTSVASAPQSAAPNMIGDFLYTGTTLIAADPLLAFADVPSPSARRFKISENDSVLPQDRVFFTYNYYDDAYTVDTSNFRFDPALRDFDYNSYVVGAEKTLLGGAASVAVRLPINSSVDFNSLNFDLNNDGGIGNIPITFKALLASTCDYSFGAGLTVMTPTGDDVTGTVNDISYTIENNSVHLMPYIGLFSHRRCSPWFAQTTLQLDFDANGNELVATSPFVGGAQVADVEDPTLLYWDATVGYWLTRNYAANSGVAGIVEIHYTTDIEDSDAVFVADGDTIVGLGSSHFDIWNATLAAHFQMGRTDLRVGYVVPLSDDEAFDYEIVVQLNQRF